MNIIAELIQFYRESKKRKSNVNQKSQKKRDNKNVNKKKDTDGVAIFIKQMKAIRPLIVEILNNNYQARDNDLLLMLEIWHVQYPVIKSFSHFKTLLLKGKLATPETISRTRRKLQEQNDKLRGDMYESRKHQEKIIANQLNMEFE